MSESKRQKKVDVAFRNYLYHSAVMGNPLMGKELDMAVRANKAIKKTVGTIPHGSGNQFTDNKTSDGLSRHTMKSARALRKQLVQDVQPKGNLQSGQLTAVSAEITRGANCMENAELTTFNLIADSPDRSLTAERMTLLPTMDHAYSQLRGSEMVDKWVSPSKGKWVKQGQERRDYHIVADSWIVNPTAVRSDDWVFDTNDGSKRHGGQVTGVDHVTNAKSYLKKHHGVDDSFIQQKRLSIATTSHKKFSQLDKSHLYSEFDHPTHDEFGQDLAKPLAARNKLLNSIRTFNPATSLKPVTGKSFKGPAARKLIADKTQQFNLRHPVTTPKNTAVGKFYTTDDIPVRRKK